MSFIKDLCNKSKVRIGKLMVPSSLIFILFFIALGGALINIAHFLIVDDSTILYWVCMGPGVAIYGILVFAFFISID